MTRKERDDNPDLKTLRDSHDGFLALKAAIEQKGLINYVNCAETGLPAPTPSKPSRVVVLQLLKSAYSLTLELLNDLQEQAPVAPPTINGEYTVTCRNSDCSAVLDDDKTCLLINEYEGLAWFCPKCRDDDLNCTITSNEPSALTTKVLDDRLESFENTIEAKVSAFLEKMNESINQSYASALTSPATPKDNIGVDGCAENQRVKNLVNVQGEVGMGASKNVKTYSQGVNRSNLCDAKRTVIVRGVTDYEKFIKAGYLTSREFHKYYPNIVISQIKPTRRGYLLLEMNSCDDAETVVRDWKPNFFASGDESTHVSILAKGGHKCVAENVDPTVLEPAISESLEAKLGVKPTHVRRMLGRNRTPSSSVMIIFDSEHDRDAAMSSGLRLEYQSCPIRLYKEVKSPRKNQCFKCYKFDHAACWCPHKRSCPHCSEDHKPEDCPVIATGDSSRLKCPNCINSRARNHSATSMNCPILSKINYG